MKSRLVSPDPGPLVVAYGLSEERNEKLQKLLKASGIRFLKAGTEDLCQKAGALCALPGYTKIPPVVSEPFPHEGMLLCGFDNGSLNRLLTLLRSNDLKVARKAVLTDTNRDWTLGELFREISKEHEMMAAARSAK